jgi:hypothetical protein
MKCWVSTFHAQAWKIIIIVLHVRTMKFYVAIVEEFNKKKF